MARPVSYVISALAAAAAVACFIGGGALLIVLGVVLLLVALGALALATVLGRDPQQLVDRLEVRRQELERRSGRSTEQN